MKMKKALLLCILILALVIGGCASSSTADEPAAALTPQAGASSPDNAPAAIPLLPPSPTPQAQANTGGGEVFEIKEKMFIAQCNDVYLNPPEYVGKTIKLEGIYDKYTDVDGGRTYNYVIRYGPGCCGNDGTAGFEFLYDGDLPELGDWIEAIGTVEMAKEGDYEYVVLRLSKLSVLTTRGAEFVTQ
jgi:hypothetical protein